MKKEVILSLLITSPVAFPALAGVNLSDLTKPGEQGANWKSEASSFIDGYKADGAGMYCPVGIKSISRVLNLPQGTYTISLNGAVNCKLLVNDGAADANVEVVTDSKKNVTGFKIKSGSKVAVNVKIVPSDAKKDFSFTSLDLELDFNFIIAENEIAGEYGKIAPLEEILSSYRGVENKSAAATDLKKEYTELGKYLKKLTDAKADVETETLAAYINHSLWANPNTLVDSIRTFVPMVKTYNTKVKAENTRFQTNTDNSIAKKELLAAQKDLVEKVNALNEQIAAILKDKKHEHYDYVVKENFKGQGDELAAALPGLKTQIETVYADANLDNEIDATELDNTFATLENTYEELNAYLNGASADKLAYEEFKSGKANDFIALMKAYQTAVIELSEDPAAKPKEYPVNAFAEKSVELNLRLDEAYKAAEAYVTVNTNEDGTKSAVLKRIGGASENIVKVTEAIDNANAVIAEVNSEWEAFCADQNSQMATAYADIKAANDALTASTKDLSIPAQFQPDLNKLTGNVTGAITKMKNAIDAAYGKNLSADSYATEKANVEKAQQAVDEYVVKVARISSLYGSYNDLKKKVNEVDVDGFLNGLYANDYKTIDADFAALKKVDDTKAIDAIEKKIDDLNNASNGLIEAFDNANVMKDYNAFMTYIESGKTIVAGAEAARTEIKKAITDQKVKASVDKVDAKIKDIIAAHTSTGVMDTYNAIVKLNEEAGPVRESIKALRAQFTKDASAKNLAVVQGQIDYLQEVIDKAHIMNKEKPANAQTELDKLQAKVNATQSNINSKDGSDEKAYSEYDKTIKETYIGKDIPAIEKIIKETKANYEAYTALKKLANKLKSRISDLEAFNNDISKAGALKYYDGLINDAKTGYKVKEAELRKKIDDANKANIDLKKNCKALKSKIEGEINDYLNGTVEPTFDAIRLNESNHDEQMLAADRVRMVLDNVNKELANTGDAGAFNPFAEDLKKLSERLTAANQEVTENYGKGKSASLTATIIPEYDKIEADAKAILDNFTPAYNKAIRDKNEALLTDFGWTKLFEDLNKTYNTSVKTFIDYAYNVTNAGYKAHINETTYPGNEDPGFSNIAILFNYQPEIGKLQSAVAKYVNEQNATVDDQGNAHEPVLITEEGLAQFLADGNALNSNMKTVGDKATAEANYFAEEYWHIMADAQSIYDAKAKELEDGGVANYSIQIQDPKDSKKEIEKKIITVLADALKADNTAINAAKKLAYGVDKDGKLNSQRKEALGNDMNAIANELDKVQPLTDAQKQSIAMDMWSISHKKTADRIAAINAEIDAFGFVTDKEKAAAKEDINKVAAEIAKINGEAVKVNEGLLGESLTGFMTDLETQWNLVDSKYTTIKDLNDNNKANHDLFVKYTGNIEDLRADFKKLCDFGGTLAADNTELKNIGDAIDALEAKVEANKADYTSVKSDIENTVTTLKKQTIPGGYATIADAEIQALTAKVTEVRSAWAEASGKETSLDLDAIRTQINDLEGRIYLGEGDDVLLKKVDKAKAIADKTESINAIVALSGEMSALETELSEIELTLKESWMTESPLKTLTGELSERYIEISNAIASLGEYDEKVQAAFQADFDGFQARLDAVKDAWEAAGNNVIMLKGNYFDGMDAISEDVDAKLAEVKAMQKKITDHNNAYTKLKGQYDAQVKALDTIKARLDADDVFFPKTPDTDEDGKPVLLPNEDKTKFLDSVKEIETRLAETLKDLEKQNAGGEMTDASTLKGWAKETTEDNTELESIPETISSLNSEVLLHIDGALVEVMTDELKKLYEGIKAANILPEQKEDILARYKALGEKAKTAYEKPSADKDNETGEKRLELAVKNIAAVHAILDEANALVAEGEENTFKAGDLNRDGEVDLIDVQQMITLVGEGVNYSDLVEAGETVKAAAADINKDGRFTTADISGVIDASLNAPTNFTMLHFAASRSVVESADIVSTSFVSEEAGVRRFAVNLQNSAALVGGEIDILLPEGMTLVEVNAADRAANHEVALFHHSSSTKRVILYNLENAAIEGSTGAVIYVDVIGDGNIDVDNVIFSDKMTVEYGFNKNDGTSGIGDTMIDNSGSVKERIYNVAGQALRSIQRGVNIIRKSDGSVSKEYHK